jgi:hypothetical protein
MSPVEATAGCVETSIVNCIFSCIRAMQLILVTCHLSLKIKGRLESGFGVRKRWTDAE